MKAISNSTCDEVETEIINVSADESTPFVEKNLKLGYLYFHKDYLGTATNIFKNIVDKVSIEKTNSEFFKENEKGLNILYMGFRIIPDGCGGFDVIESGCGVDCCGPICGCLGIVTVMAICGISADQVCSYNSYTGESGGCIGNCGTSCCNGCADCYGCDCEFT